MLPFSDLLLTKDRYPKKVAIYFKEKSITFYELFEMSVSFCSHLQKRGVKRGDHLLILLPNCLEFAIAYFGSLCAGTIPVIIDHRTKAFELGEIISEISPKFIVAEAKIYESIKNFSDYFILKDAKGSSYGPNVISFDNVFSEKGEFSYEKPKPEDEAIYIYTSGSTGLPKGVILTYKNLYHGPRILESMIGIDKDWIFGFFLPMSHISGPLYLNMCAEFGLCLVLFDTISPQAILSATQEYRINIFHGVPPIFRAIVKFPRVGDYDTSSLKIIAMMGMTVPREIIEECKKVFPHASVIQGYGLTESSIFITLLPPEDELRKIGSIGYVVPGIDVKIVDESGKEVGNGEIGEIITKGYHVMKGYYKREKETKEKIKDGWLYTGDMAYFDNEGYLYHVGRKDDMVIVGGLNVYPREIENAVYCQKDVLEAFAMGVEDKKRGASIALFVVKRKNSSLTERDLLSILRKSVASYKVPKIVKFLEEIPKNRVGKPDKLRLKKILESGLSTQTPKK